MEKFIDLYQKIFMNEKSILFNKILHENNTEVIISNNGSITVSKENYTEEELRNISQRCQYLVKLENWLFLNFLYIK